MPFSNKVQPLFKKEVFSFKYMATPEQCPFYNNCGFVKFRKERPDKHSPVLPENGDCGKSFQTCGRADPIIPISLEAHGPVTHEEIKIVYPEIPDKSGKKHRLVGGAHK